MLKYPKFTSIKAERIKLMKFLKQIAIILILSNTNAWANESLNNTINAYFASLEAGSCDQTLQLFTQDAVVNSPLYGTMKAQEFYQKLFSATNRSKITLQEIFFSNTSSNNATAHFLCDWILKDGTPAPFECVDIFEFEPTSNKIRSLKIIYDTYHIRGAFNSVKS